MSLNLVNPPQMDTVAIPGAGYAILRFKADNPGKGTSENQVFFISQLTSPWVIYTEATKAHFLHRNQVRPRCFHFRPTEWKPVTSPWNLSSRITWYLSVELHFRIKKWASMASVTAPWEWRLFYSCKYLNVQFSTVQGFWMIFCTVKNGVFHQVDILRSFVLVLGNYLH